MYTYIIFQIKKYTQFFNKYEKIEFASFIFFKLFQEEQAAGKGTNWHELEINCGVRNLSPLIFKWTHLTALYLNDNRIQVLPACIARLWNLKKLDLTNNKIR